MTAPLWQAGHLYLPGDIVQPITAPATTPVAITNPGFETGTDAGWTLGTATAVSTADKFTGTYSIAFSGTGGITDTVQATASAVQVGQSITARVMYQQGAASAGHNGGRVMLVFYTAGMVAIGSPSLGNLVDSGSGGAWGQSTVTAVAPDTAAFVKIGIRVNRTNSSPSWADDFAWNHVAQAPAGLVFKAVQANAGVSGTSEPAWPNTVGLTVVDNQVTWEAIAATRVEWTAAPILVSGATEPTWPTQIGEFVADGSIKWEAFSRRVEDENCPNSRIVAIVGSKVFSADRDIARFCATANPLDWTTERDAGYLPLGLQQANANDFNTGVFNQYRSNFVAFNASSFQNWQADPDPEAMALLDQMDGIGSTWQQAAQPVANDLFYLAALGVRTVGIAGGSTNLQAGDVGMPIDPLVKDAVRTAVANGSAVRSTYYPSSGQYWLAFADFPPALPSISGDVPDGDVGDAISGAYTVSGGVLPYGPVTVLSGTFPPGLTLNPDGTYSGIVAMSGTYSWTVGGVDADGVPFSTPDTATYIGVSVWIAQQDLSENYARSASGTNWQEEANRLHAGFSTQHVSALDGRIITGAAATASYAQSIDGALTFAAYPAMPEGTSSGGKTIKVDGVYLSPRGQLPTNGVARTTDLGGSWSTVLVSGSGTNNMHAISARIGLAIVATSGGRVSRSLDNGASWSALVQVFAPGVGIQGIANNGDRFVLVGDDHTMMYTDDGLTFHPITSPFTRSGGTASQNVIGAVACGNGVFVAGVDTAVGGTAGQLAYSLDGENFATTAVGLGGGCLCLAYADGLFVSAGRNSKIATSPDGPNWTQRANHFAGDIRSVTALIGPPLS